MFSLGDLKEKAYEWIHKPKPKLNSLPILILMPVEGCNCRCSMCDIWKLNQEGKVMSLETIQALLDEAKSLNTRQLVLTGGEPLLHPHIAQILELAKSLNFRITLLTSGLLVKKHAESISKFVDELVISLDGPAPLHNMTRGVKKAFELTKEGLAILDPKPNVIARHVLQKASFTSFAKTVEAAQDLGANQVSFLGVDTSETAFNHQDTQNILNLLGLSKDECHEFEMALNHFIQNDFQKLPPGFIRESPEELNQILQHLKALAGLQEFPGGPCNAPWFSAVMDTRGKLHPCFFHKGGFSEGGIEAQLNHAKSVEFRKNLDVATDPICQRCVCRLWVPWKAQTHV